MRRKAILSALGGLLILVLFAIVWMREPYRMGRASLRQRSEAIERGAKLYAANCAQCHGADGSGLSAPPLNLKKFREGEPAEMETMAEFLYKTIARGRAGMAMPPFLREEGGPLNSQQIQDLVAFIQYGDWGKVLAQPPSTPSPTAELGPQLFKQKCIVCHKLGEEGGTIGPDLSKIGRQREMDWLLRWLENPQAVKPGATMPRIPLTEEERKALAEYLAGLK